MTATCGDAGGVTLAGALCRATLNLSPASGRCLSHDPDRVAQKLEAVAKGGIAGGISKRRKRAAVPDGAPKAPKTLADAVKFASWAVHAVAIGELDSRTGHEVGFLLNTFRGSLEKAELVREIEKLREELAQARKAPRAA